MATRRRTQTTGYQTYGNVAYVPAYDGSAVRAPQREELTQPLPKPRVRERQREKVLTRTQVQVREAGWVSPFGVIGFLAVGVFAALLLFSYTQYTVLTDQIVDLRGELTALQTEGASLSAQYEQVFDMTRIQAAVGDTMVRPSPDQIVYLDLSEPDNVVLYRDGEQAEGVDGLVQGLSEIVTEVIEYFR